MGHDSRLNPFSKDSTIIGGALTVIDARGRPLAEGDELLLQGMTPYFRVKAIKPHETQDPSIPRGLVEVILISYIRLVLPPGQADQNLVRVQTAEEIETLKQELEARKNGGPKLVVP